MIEGDIVKEVHVGEALRLWCKKNNLTRQKLADKMKLPKSNIDRIFAKSSIDTNKLLDISHCLDYNFFADFWGQKYIIDAETWMDYVTTPPSYIHIGHRIEMHLREKKITQNQLAAHLGVQHPVISKMLKKTSIDSGRLVIISNYLEHDFFSDFYKINDPDEAENNSLTAGIKRYEHLVIENNMLQSEVALLKEKIKSQQFQIGKLEKDLGIKFDTSLNGPLVKIDYPISSELLEKLKVIAEHYNIDFQTFMDLAFNRGIEMLADKYESTGTVEDLIR